jgi:hypothetical protein
MDYKGQLCGEELVSIATVISDLDGNEGGGLRVKINLYRRPCKRSWNRHGCIIALTASRDPNHHDARKAPVSNFIDGHDGGWR